MKTLEELRKFDQKKLHEELIDAKKDLFKIKFDVDSNQSKNTHLIKKNRVYIAQIKTLLKELTIKK
jgi:ribosomal protein L29